MNYDLFNAILSMDSYNRGYGAGIILAGTQIGVASIGIDSDELGTIDVNGVDIRRDQEIGFYAVAYDIQGAGTIISFRGTDDYGAVPDPSDLDVYHGWPLGNGNYDSEQGQMAVQFYNLVAGSSDPLLAPITTTGHSLGGGLAGYVSSLYDRDALIFDSMAFEDAVNDNNHVEERAAA